MEVQRVPSQGGGSLRELYASRADDPASPSAGAGRRMLALLDALAAADGPRLWGETSHLTLRLSADPAGLGGVCIDGNGPGYWVESRAGSVWAADADGAVALVVAGLELPGSVMRQLAGFLVWLAGVSTGLLLGLAFLALAVLLLWISPGLITDCLSWVVYEDGPIRRPLLALLLSLAGAFFALFGSVIWFCAAFGIIPFDNAAAAKLAAKRTGAEAARLEARFRRIIWVMLASWWVCGLAHFLFWIVDRDWPLRIGSHVIAGITGNVIVSGIGISGLIVIGGELHDRFRRISERRRRNRRPECWLVCPCGHEIGLEVCQAEMRVGCQRCGKWHTAPKPLARGGRYAVGGP